MKNKIVCFHVNNGFTGSPNVLATVVQGLFNENYDVALVTSFNNSGFLSNVNCSRKKNISYIFKKNKFLRLIQFLKFQLFSGIFLFGINKKDVIYLNTIQPFFPAVIAKLKGNRIIYHFHESYPKMSLFTKFLYFVVEITANEIICVSEYVLNQLNDKCQKKAIVIHNSLSSDYFDKQIKVPKVASRKRILMVSSAREYKGIFEFCKLAILLDEYDFTLVCDASKQDILLLFHDYKTIRNLEIVETQTNLHPFYSKTDLIVNFSIPSLFIETFGLTILEGMTYGIPCIVPPVGGITELVQEGSNGYKVDSRETTELIRKIKLILNDELKYKKMSDASIYFSKNFSYDTFISKVKLVIQ
ncbi:glycosyltransferase family 4 protein [Flavobacterium ovatum]|uniref:glycosyltransferase family 4 protein n=1 Tax=Flavobacterium ovatum TaxID=1928857 RepID=UPI00344BE865